VNDASRAGVRRSRLRVPVSRKPINQHTVSIRNSGSIKFYTHRSTSDSASRTLPLYDLVACRPAVSGIGIAESDEDLLLLVGVLTEAIRRVH
jgi:hypothetical protein